MNARSPSEKPTVLIASPLEDVHVDRIRAHGADRILVVHEPDLLPKTRYVGDHRGAPRTVTPEMKARWSALLANADILFDFDLLEPADLPRNAPRVRWVQATSSGIGEFLKSTGLDQSDIIFTTAAGVHARPLAEFSMLGLLHFFRDVPKLNALKAAKHWERYTVRGLQGARMLVIGLGAVGQAIASDAARFGMDVWGMRHRSEGALPQGVSRIIVKNELRAALAHIDALVLACPLTAETRLLIDRPEIVALKPGVVVVNVARGAVIHEDALAEALRAGHISGAALDAFTVEPLPKDSPLWALPNVLISPHSASTVAAENGHIVDIFLDNLDRYLAGRPLRNEFERSRGY
jgi:glyoxylate/hydroxypyruvate reductase A